MSWLRQNAILVIFVVAVAVSFVVNNNDSKARDRAQHAQIVSQCVVASARFARQVSYQMRTAEARRDSGVDPVDPKTHLTASADYDAFAQGGLESIPVPAGIKPGDPAMIEVKLVRGVQGKPKYVVTARAKALQKAGCERANP